MELYALIGLAVVTILIIRRKMRGGGVDMQVSSPIIKPFNHQPMDIDEHLLTSTPLRPPSPMSTGSSSDEAPFLLDSNYIK